MPLCLPVVTDTLTVAEIGRLWFEHESNELRGQGATGLNYPFTYSLLDLRQMDLLLEKQNALAEAIKNSLTSAENRRLILEAFRHTECFDSNPDFLPAPDDAYCDLFSFAQQLESRFQGNLAIAQAAHEVWSVITDTVRLAESHNNGRPWQRPDQLWAWDNLGGVSIYLPLEVDDWRRNFYTETHLRAAAEGLWDEFLWAYWDNANAPAAPDACSPNCPFVGPGSLEPYAIYLPILSK